MASNVSKRALEDDGQEYGVVTSKKRRVSGDETNVDVDCSQSESREKEVRPLNFLLIGITSGTIGVFIHFAAGRHNGRGSFDPTNGDDCHADNCRWFQLSLQLLYTR